MSKKVLGINFGRRKGQSRLYLKYVLDAAQAEGCETEVINTVNMKIGLVTDLCVKDDFEALRDAVMDADALVLACPTYALTPVGQYKNFVDRMAAWLNDLPDRAQVKRPRPIAFIATGGAADDHWVSLNLPIMKLLAPTLGCKVVDEMSIHGTLPDKDRLERMGRALAEGCGKDHTQIPFIGDMGVCPVCHSNFISLVPGGGMKVECPICGIEGSLSIENGEIKVYYPPEVWERSRFTIS